MLRVSNLNTQYKDSHGRIVKAAQTDFERARASEEQLQQALLHVLDPSQPYLQRVEQVLAFASAREVDGGSGAILVLLRAAGAR